MFKTIFAKQLTFYMSALVISFVILAVGMNMVISRYFIAQKSYILEEQSENIAEIYAQNMIGSLNILETKRNLQYELNNISEYLDASLFIVENDVITVVTEDLEEYKGATFDTANYSGLEEGKVVTAQGNLNGIFSEQVLTVAYPIMVNDQLSATVFLSSSMPELQKYSNEIFRLTLLCLLISGFAAFILIFYLSRTMTKPLHEMNLAAKVISNGDFKQRIYVKNKDEVGQLAESLNNMAESLHEQDQLRRIFIANVSHDLRSPLTSIRGFLQAILDGTIPPEKENYYLNVIMEETERLSKLTHDIIDLEKIQSPEIDLIKTTFDINDIVRKTVLMFEATAYNKKLSVKLNFANEENFVYGDNEKIQRVLYNLIDNAIKFTDENGTITVETTIKEKKLSISVIDNGRGISVADQKYIFDRFYKVDASRGEDRMGSGLGLSIIMAFLRAHNESVVLKSEEGKGSTFTFELPLITEKEKSKQKTID